MHSTALSLLFLSALASQAPASGPHCGLSFQDAVAAPVDERTRELSRILYLSGGGALRAKARWNGELWEYHSGGRWAALPAAAVERVALERDVLAQSRELAGKVRNNDPAQRTALADWNLRAGLLEEGVRELERVLRADPDQPNALALLRHSPVPIAVPGADAEKLDDAVRLGATAPRSLQEMAIAELGRRAETASVMEALERGLVSHSARIRGFAALAMRRLDPKADLRGLLQRAVLDGSDAVRLEAALALRDAREEALVLPMLRAMASTSPAVRANAVEALGTMGYEAALAPLINRLAALSAPQSGGGWRAPASNIFVGRQVAYVQDFDVEVAQFAAVADPVINTLIEGSVLDVRVIGVYETSFAIESRGVRGALQTIARVAPGNSNKSWLDWWEANKARFDVRTPARPPETEAQN